MMKVTVHIMPKDLERLKLANRKFGVGDEILNAKNLIEWAFRTAIDASEYEPGPE